MAAIVDPTAPSPSPVCSICIANYNGRGFVEKAIESVLRQDCDFPVEIIVCDDASSDGSAAFVRSHFPEVKLLEASVNAGFCASNNRMALQARGSYLLLLNNDAELFPSALRLLYDAARREKSPVILGLPQYNAFTGELIDRGSLLDPFLNSVPNANESRSITALATGACLWIPNVLWREVGGFPPFFDSVAEDTYLCCSARLRGYQVKIVLGSGFRHRIGSSLGGGKVVSGKLSTTFRRRSLSERNRVFVQAILCPAPIVYPLLSLHIVLLVLEGIILSIVKQNMDIWHKIYLPTFRGLKTFKNEIAILRKKTQKKRRISILSYFSLFTLIPHKLLMLIKYGVPLIR
jgi:glycosyltransferase involved in cell wall biosynthesis